MRFKSVVLSAAVLFILAATGFGAVRTVGGDDADYGTIADAVAAADAGDTVRVAEGVYDVSEGITVETARLVLEGAGADRTFLDGKGEAYAVVSVKAEGVVVTGFTLENGSSHGVYINESNWANIHHNVITGNEDRGILLGMGTPYAVIDHNTFAANKVSAIYSYRDEAKTKFTNNIVWNNGRSIVVDADSNRMTIRYNCFFGQSNDDEWLPKHKTNIAADPKFVDQGGDYHLEPGSPCLGKGEGKSNIGALGTGKNPGVVAPKPAQSGLGQYRVVIFTNDQEMGEKVLASLQNAGFTNDESYVTDDPNDDANIKYGSATEDVVQRIRDIVKKYYPSEVELDDSFESDDDDIFVNLP